MKNTRTALIVGGTKGLGLEIAYRFLNEGYKVAIIGRNFDYIQPHQKSIIRQFCELTDNESIKSAITEIYSKVGSIDVVVNCAAVLDKFDIEKISLEQWNEIISVNLTAPFFVIQEALPYLKLSGHGRVINISSNAGRMGGFENGACYAATKGGLISMTYNLARKLAPFGITVNCVAPGPFETNMFSSFSNESREQVISKIPLNRIGKTYEIAEAVVYFASINSSYTTGSVLDVNGGIFMG
jgi:3-oxoacyl-[acyl-carrier protein] reductase